MPAIPLFESTEPYSFVPLQGPNPGQDSQAAGALAGGAAQVGDAATVLGGRAAELMEGLKAQQRRAQQVTTAAALDSQSAVALNKLYLAHVNDPDYQAAPDKFQQDAADLKQQTLAGINDPQVAALVSRSFDQRLAYNTINLQTKAFQSGNAAQIATGDASGDNYVQMMAKGGSAAEFKQNLDMLAANYNGMAHAMLITPEQARASVSAKLRQALEIRAETDPAGAQSLYQANQALLTGGDMLGVTERLQPLLRRAQGNAVGAQAFAAATGASVPGGVVDAIIGNESGGDPNVANPQSSASGTGQFLDSTWLSVLRTARPDLAPQSDAALLAMKKDPVLARQMVGAYAEQNSAALQQAGFPATPANIYLAHGLGAAGAIKVLQADPGTPMASLTSPDVIAKNPAYQGKTAGQVLAYFGTKMAGAGSAAGSGPLFPDLDKAMTVINAIADPEVRERAMAAFQQQYHGYEAAHSQQIAAMNDRLMNVEAGLKGGIDVDVPTAADLRPLYPPEKVAAITSTLGELQQGANYAKMVTLATPADLARLQQQYSVPTDGSVGADGLKVKLQQQTMLNRAIVARQQALSADPASYVASRDPAVAAAYKAIDPANPATFEAYAAAARASEERLGVASADIRVLPVAGAQAKAAELLNADPSKTDVGGQLDAMAKTYGAAWPDAWHDLVRDGKMPEAWQVLAQMPPGPDRISMQRSLQAAVPKGGLEGMRKDIAQSDAQSIQQGIDGNADFSGFARTLMIPGVASNPGLLSATRNAIQTNAIYRVMNGADAETALRQAAAAALPYDWEGTARAPKGQGSLAASTAATMVQALKPDDLMAPAGGAGMRPDDAQSAYLRAVQRGATWITNERGDGWTLAVRDNNGGYQFPLKKDGSKIGFRFADMTEPPPATTDPLAGLAGLP